MLSCSQFETVVVALTHYALTAASPGDTLAVLRSLDQKATAHIIERVLAERATRTQLVALAATTAPAPERMPL